MRSSTLACLAIGISLLANAACGREPEPTPLPLPTRAPAAALDASGTATHPTETVTATATQADEIGEPEAIVTAAETVPAAPLAMVATAGPSPTSPPTATPGPLPEGLPTSDPESWPAGNLSPDGRWWVRSQVGEELAVAGGRVVEDVDSGSVEEVWYHRGQQVVDTEGVTVHTVLDQWARSGMGAPEPAVLGWAPDGSWVYLYETGQADGCGIYPWGRDLRRFAPESGEMQYLHDWMPGAPALSPDGRTVALYSPPHMLLLRPDDGSFLEALIPGGEQDQPQVGELSFDAEGRLELTVDYDACSEQWTRARARLDLTTGRVELLGTPVPVPLP